MRGPLTTHFIEAKAKKQEVHSSTTESPLITNGGEKALSHRADIDGLRAVAILSVLASHVGLNRLRGGFIGVDVFFVISGYLISLILLSEITGRRFSLIRFYERRARRIFPALFAMLIVFAICNVFYLLPDEFVSFGKSMLGVTGFVSNFFFWKHSGYFDAPLSQPLLHTWSLAVEEQFYVCLPLFLVLVHKRFPKRLQLSVVVLFLTSLIISAVVVSRSRNTAFYMPYTRAWELLMGTLLALRTFKALRSVLLRNAAAAIGFGLIVFSAWRYTPETLFPGLSALVPCIGAALIIEAGKSGSSLVGRLLSWRPMVFIGLISYSLYLWHWPVIVMQQMGLINAGVIAAKIGHGLISQHQFDVLFELALSFVLAALSWKFVENPFRTGRLRLGGRPLLMATATAMAVLVACSSWIIFADGFKGRFPAAALQVASNRDENHMEFQNGCFVTSDNHMDSFNSGVCLQPMANERNILLLGDSHSAMLSHALTAWLKNDHLMQASCFNCPPLLNSENSPDCKKMMSYIFDNYLLNHPISEVYLVARWQRGDLTGLTRTIEWAKQHGIQVAVFGPVPEYYGPLPRLLAYSIAWNRPNLAGERLVTDQAVLDVQMQKMAADVWHVPYVSLYRQICDSGRCIEYADKAKTVPMLSDANHLSPLGASFVVRRLVEQNLLQ